MTSRKHRTQLSYRDRQARLLSRVITVLVMIVAVPAALSAPGDITEIAAPQLGEDAPKAQDIAAGDASVATQTGALNYLC